MQNLPKTHKTDPFVATCGVLSEEIYCEARCKIVAGQDIGPGGGGD